MNNENNNHQNSYGVFCMSDRLLAFDICDIDNLLDERWEKAIREYEKFLGSKFNVDTKSELDCIDDYLNSKTSSSTLVDSIIAYESGELNDQEVVCLFAELVKSGMAWSLQGSYGRTANDLIKEGWIDRKGNVSLAVLEL